MTTKDYYTIHSPNVKWRQLRERFVLHAVFTIVSDSSPYWTLVNTTSNCFNNPTNRPILSMEKPNQLWSDIRKRYCNYLNLGVALYSLKYLLQYRLFIEGVDGCKILHSTCKHRWVLVLQHTWKFPRSYENGSNSMNPHSACSIQMYFFGPRLLFYKILCDAMINEAGTMEPFTFSLTLSVAAMSLNLIMVFIIIIIY